MPKEWDHLMKWLAPANPQHLVSLLMEDAIFCGPCAATGGRSPLAQKEVRDAQ